MQVDEGRGLPRMGGWRSVLAALGVGLLALASQSSPVRGDVEPPRPLDGLNEAELARFEDGSEQFQHRYSPQEGLGPVFNGRSCTECHSQPGPGGSHDSDDRQVVLFGRSNFAGSLLLRISDAPKASPPGPAE